MLGSLVDLAASIQESSKIVVLAGAGCSVASGIPCFRGPNGLLNVKTRNLFHWNNSSLEEVQNWTLELGCLYFDEIRNKSPNNFHLLLRDLDRQKKLCHIFTMNIDDLERKAGLKEKITHLHGRISKLRCLSCSKIRGFSIQHVGMIKKGQRIYCSCFSKRKRQGKKKPIFVSDVVCYNDPRHNPVSDGVVEHIKELTPDLFIIAGCSLDPMVKGSIDLVKILTKKSKKTVFLNIQEPPKWLENSVLFFRGDIDEICKTLLPSRIIPLENLKSIFDQIRRFKKKKFSKSDLAKLLKNDRPYLEDGLKILLQEQKIRAAGNYYTIKN